MKPARPWSLAAIRRSWSFDDADPEQGGRHHRGVQVSATRARSASRRRASTCRKGVLSALPRSASSEHGNGIKLGDGLEKGTTMGPLANARRLDAMDAIVADAKSRGGKVADRRRARRQPGLLLQADRDHRHSG